MSRLKSWRKAALVLIRHRMYPASPAHDEARRFMIIGPISFTADGPGASKPETLFSCHMEVVCKVAREARYI